MNSHIVDEAITSRTSVRAFLPTPISQQTVSEILQVASRAPSGSNTQPWKVQVLTGAPLQTLSQKMLIIHNNPEVMAQQTEPYDYYPTRWEEPYISRRRKIGWGLYSLLGIERDNKVGMHAQVGRNFAFFDAPVALMFSIDNVMNQGSWLDYGMFIQNIMVAARARGLDTCPQAALNHFHQTIKDFLKLGKDETFVCGMSLGYADHSKIENSLKTERAPVSEFATFYGF